MFLMPASGSAQVVTIDTGNWGAITAPVYGATERGAYAGAELFAGPNKLGTYFAGVLPNGRVVQPAGITIQVGMNPLGTVLTPDGKYLVTSNDDERDGGFPSYQSTTNTGGYSLSVIDTSTMTVVSHMSAGHYFIGLAASGAGPYTLYASGGPDNDVKLFTISTTGTLAAGNPASIPIKPILPATAGYVSNYTPAASLNTADANGVKPPVPTGFNRTGSNRPGQAMPFF
jgi:hypothetical protein